MIFKYADFITRFLALFIDFIIILFIVVILFFLIIVLPAIIKDIKNITVLYSDFLLGIIIQSIGFLTFTIYFAFMESKFGQTIGKKIFRLKVIDRDNKKLTFKISLLRTILFVLSGVAFCIGFIFFFFTKEKQCLHDIFTKSYVIYKT